MPREVLDVEVRASHEDSLKIAAHCHSFEGTRLAVEAGIDSIEHGTYVDQPTLELIAERGTYMVPTISTGTPGSILQPKWGGPGAKCQKSTTARRKEKPIASFRHAPNRS